MWWLNFIKVTYWWTMNKLGDSILAKIIVAGVSIVH